MFKRNRVLRITAYLLSGVVLNLAMVTTVALLASWLIPDPLLLGVTAFLGGFIGGSIIDVWLFARYNNRYR